MKNLAIVILTGIVLLSFTTQTSLNTNFGYIDSRIIHDNQTVADNNAEIEAFADELYDKMKAIEKKYGDALTEGNEELANSLEQEYTNTQKEFDPLVGAKRKEIFESYLKEFNGKIEEMGKEGNYSIIFDIDGTILYSKEEMNLTEKLLSKLKF